MSEINTAFMTTVEKLWEEKKYNTLRDVLSTMQPAQVADLLSALPENAPAMLFRLMPKELAADTFVEMDPDMQEALIKSFSDTELKGVLNELYMDDAVDLVEEMPANVVRRILAQADPEMRKSINELLRYPDDSAGSIMTTEYVDLRPSFTVEESYRIADLQADLETVQDEFRLQAITGQIDIDAEWDGYVEKCKALGFDELMEIDQAAVDRYLAK